MPFIPPDSPSSARRCQKGFLLHESEIALVKKLPCAKEVEPALKARPKSLAEPLLSADEFRTRKVVLNDLIKGIGYATHDHAEPVRTRDGDQEGRVLFQERDSCLRSWTYSYETDLDMPAVNGLNFRF